MATCPTCNENAISAFDKLVSGEARCVRCRQCSAWAYAPSWVQELTVVSAAELFTYAGITAMIWSLLDRSPAPLLVVMAAAILYAIVRIRFARLIAVSADEASIRHDWGRAAMYVGLVVLAGMLILAALRWLPFHAFLHS